MTSAGTDSDPAQLDAGLIVGILGGMGPAATAEFFRRLTAATPAEVDQDHLRVLVWSDPKVPDRSAALFSGGADPTPALIRGAEALKRAGATLFTVPCNTAHVFLEPVEEAVGIKFIHMIEATAHRLSEITPQVKRIGLLATTATLRSRIYDRRLEGRDIQVVSTTDAEQDVVTEVIRAVKSGSHETLSTHVIAAVGNELVTRGAEALVVACTEVSLIFDLQDTSVPVIDTTDVLVAATLAAAHKEPHLRRDEIESV